VTGSVRIMSANLFKGRARADVLAGTLRRVDPDVLCVQELDPVNAEVIAGAFEVVSLDPREDANGLGIAARSGARLGTIAMALRDARTATVPFGAGTLEVVDLHLANPVERPWRRSAAIRSAQLAAVERHAVEVDGPFVIVGDMNASPAWSAYRRLAGGFVDLAVAAVGKPPPTWSYRHRLPRLLRIDHAFGRDVEPVSFTVERLAFSDHDAIVVEVAPSG